MMRSVVAVLAVAAFVYLGACASLFFFQRSLIYFPQPGSLDSSSQIRLPVDGAELRVSVRPLTGTDALMYFGGNAEDVSASLPSLSTAFPGHAIFLMHYRGYGGSSGSPSEAALHRDALALFDRIKADHPDVSVVGRSLGTGVAVRLATERPVSRVVLVTPYDSLQDLAAAQFPFFPVRWLLADKYESWRHAPKVTAPTTIILAEHDEVIPRASTEQLHSRFAPGVAVLKVVPGAGHNTVSANALYREYLRGSSR
jgi:pimeloyl-ACP methyl ester carboxylesterase